MTSVISLKTTSWSLNSLQQRRKPKHAHTHMHFLCTRPLALLQRDDARIAHPELPQVFRLGVFQLSERASERGNHPSLSLSLFLSPPLLSFLQTANFLTLRIPHTSSLSLSSEQVIQYLILVSITAGHLKTHARMHLKTSLFL